MNLKIGDDFKNISSTRIVDNKHNPSGRSDVIN